jgi:hypothetical protein
VHKSSDVEFTEQKEDTFSTKIVYCKEMQKYYIKITTCNDLKIPKKYKEKIVPTDN